MTRSLILAATTALSLMAGAAAAGQPVYLRESVMDDDGRITLGELFEDAGRAASVLVYATPAGSDAVLDAALVQRVALANGLSWANERGLRRIIVRAGAPAPSAAGSRAVEALTYVRSLAAGQMISADDLAWTKVVAAPSDAPRDADSVIGMAAKRPLRAGAAVARRDLAAPQVIAKDDVVSVSYNADGINLTLQAKAMKAAGAGDTVDVMNPASKRIIQAIAVGPGRAVVGPDAIRYRTAAAGGQFASLR